jgi:hypothetical protein
MGDRRNIHKVLVGKPKGKRQLGRPTRRRKNNIKSGFSLIGNGGMGCTDLAQDGDTWWLL